VTLEPRIQAGSARVKLDGINCYRTVVFEGLAGAAAPATLEMDQLLLGKTP